MVISWLEVAANSVNAASIGFAARNSVHTWWTGIIGCALFGGLFICNQLYADALLQLFFVATSGYGWWHWTERRNARVLPVTRAAPSVLGMAGVTAICVALGYGYLLRRFTNAYAPIADSFVLTMSILAQLLLMGRRIETWWVWLGVDALSVAIFAARGLFITATLYAGFGVIAGIALYRWRRLIAR